MWQWLFLLMEYVAAWLVVHQVILSSKVISGLFLTLGVQLAYEDITDWIPFFIKFYSSSSKLRVSNGIIGLPYHASQGVGCQLRGQNCFVEVSLGFPRSETDKALQSNKNIVRNLPKSPVTGQSDHKGSPDHLSDNEKTFLYPAEAVLVPVFQTSLARSSLKRYFFPRLTLFPPFFN